MKRSNRIFALMLALLLAISCFAGCAAKPAEQASAEQPAQAEITTPATSSDTADDAQTEAPDADTDLLAGKRVAFISAANQFDFFVYIGAKVKQIGEQNGIAVDCFDAALDVSKEADLMTQAILQKYDAIIMGPVDTNALLPSVQEANDAGIPVINYDSFMDADTYARVGSSNYEMGKNAGEWAVSYLKETKGSVSGKIIVLAYPALETMNQRIAGFVDVLKEYTDVEIQEEIVPTCDAEGGQQLVENLLIANQEGTVDMIYGSNAGVVLGASAAVEAASRTDVAIVGIDNEQGELDAISSGTAFKATVAQDPIKIGEEAMLAAIEAIKGNKSGDIVVPGILVTADNITEYVAIDAAQKAELEQYK